MSLLLAKMNVRNNKNIERIPDDLYLGEWIFRKVYYYNVFVLESHHISFYLPTYI